MLSLRRNYMSLLLQVEQPVRGSNPSPPSRRTRRTRARSASGRRGPRPESAYVTVAEPVRPATAGAVTPR